MINQIFEDEYAKGFDQSKLALLNIFSGWIAMIYIKYGKILQFVFKGVDW